MHIRELGLPPATYNVLVTDNVLSTEELIAKTPAELMRTPYFGKVKLAHVVDALKEKGLELAGYCDEDWMDDLGLSPRAKSAIRGDCQCLGDLLKLSRKKILKMYMAGPTVADEIEEVLAQRGLSLYGNQIEIQEEIDRLEKRAEEHDRQASRLRERIKTLRADNEVSKLEKSSPTPEAPQDGRS